MRIEGVIIVSLTGRRPFCDGGIIITYSPQGFDEFMNLVMDSAEEVFIKNEISRRPIGV